MFDAIDSIAWLRGRPEAALYDFATAAVGPSIADPPTIPEPLEDIVDPPAGTTLETLLAAAYDVHPEQVLITAGGEQAIYIAIATAVGHGPLDAQSSAAVVERPTLDFHRTVSAALAANTDRLDRPPIADGSLADRIHEQVTTETALVLISNAHLGSGQVAPAETLADAASVLDDGTRFLVDERMVPLDDLAASSIAGTPETVVVGSLDRFAGLAALNVGWLIGDRPFIEAARTAMDQTGTVGRPSRRFAAKAIYHAEDLLQTAQLMREESTELVAEFLDRRADLGGSVYDDSPFIFCRHENLDGQSIMATAWENGVLVFPGRFVERPETVRISFGRPPAETSAGLSALQAALDAHPE